MNILDKIITHKYQEVEARKKMYPVKLLEQSAHFNRPTLSLRDFVQREDKSGIITEFKRKSPSKGIINDTASVETTTKGYVEAGASALSVLTDKEFFGGSSDDLIQARKYNLCPILRKDFTIDEYQIVEAKSIGADAILLIAAALPPTRLKQLSLFAKSLRLEVLLEVHDKEELQANLDAQADLLGVNNRSLKTFEVSIDVSKELAPLIPREAVKISESGITAPETIVELKKFGYEGFLMGENFMKHNQPERACKEFIDKLNSLERNEHHK
jgi:indole-3-glycerol phosphate synthase